MVIASWRRIGTRITTRGKTIMTVFTAQNTRTTNTLATMTTQTTEGLSLSSEFSWVLDRYFLCPNVVHHSMELRLNHTAQPY